ncbi:MAG: C69 family dipeptidase [Caldilineaceae bacterium]|nr:C69 family dipeptidase [Caldilineaceae bacterium]
MTDSRHIPQSCDTMVALGNSTTSGQTIFAKNSDRPADECQPLILREQQHYAPGAETHCQFITIPQVATTYRHIGSRPYWCWGYEHGVNEHQVAIGNEALHSRLPEASTAKLVGMEILRLGLERSRSAAEAVAVMTDLISTYGQGKFANDAGVRTYDNGYIVADPHEAYVIETAGHDWAVKQVENAIGISNVYSVATDWQQLSASAEATATAHGWWQPHSGRFNFADTYTADSRAEGSGAMRRARSCAVLNLRQGNIDVSTMMAILGDHSNGVAPREEWQTAIRSGTGICRHPEADGSGGCTAASLVAELCDDGSRLPIYWCSLYSPCLSLFLPIFLEGTLPKVLTIGDATPSDESPWWRFHKLNQLVLNGPPDAATVVRERWQPLQQELFASAHDLAQQAQAWIDAGQEAEAAAELTRYMARNADQMMATVQSLVDELAGEQVLA